MTTVLSLEDITARRGAARVIHGLSLRIDDGEIVALLGPSGAGKSTVLRILLGLLTPDRGVVRIRDRIATQENRIVLPPDARDLAVVFQHLALWPHLTVAGNLRFVLRSRKAPRNEEPDRIVDVLSRVGLAGKENRYPGELSGGEQQRVAIARALVTRPSAILLDEPLADLDIALKRDLIALLQSLLSESGAAALYVTHDPREAEQIAHRMAVLESGRVVQEGAVEALASAPATPFVARLLDELVGAQRVRAR